MMRMIDTFKNDDGTITCPGCKKILAGDLATLTEHFRENAICNATVGAIAWLDKGDKPTEGS